MPLLDGIGCRLLVVLTTKVAMTLICNHCIPCDFDHPPVFEDRKHGGCDHYDIDPGKLCVRRHFSVLRPFSTIKDIQCTCAGLPELFRFGNTGAAHRSFPCGVEKGARQHEQAEPSVARGGERIAESENEINSLICLNVNVSYRPSRGEYLAHTHFVRHQTPSDIMAIQHPTKTDNLSMK